MTQTGEPGGAGASAVTAKKPAKLWPVRIDELKFTSDHQLMNDNTTDWTKSGALLAKPEWERKPRVRIAITHSRLKKVTAEGTFNVVNPAADTKVGTAIGNSGTKILRLKADRSVSFGPGAATAVPVTSEHDLLNLVGRLIVSLGWEIKSKGKLYGAGISSQHTIYVTYGRPVIPSESGETDLPEHGVTLRRMKKATEWVGAAWRRGKRKPVDIIEALFSRFPQGYILDITMLTDRQQEYLARNPHAWARLTDAGFADFRDDAKGGAWPLAEFARYGGECQAIVRLAKAIAHQVGLPGTFEVKYVNSQQSDPYAVRMLDSGTYPEGPEPGYGYALVPGPLRVGREYGAEARFNNYEAYLKYTEAGEVAFFGGGIGRMYHDDNTPVVRDDDPALLKVFWGLVAFTSGRPDPANPRISKNKIHKVWRY